MMRLFRPAIDLFGITAPRTTVHAQRAGWECHRPHTWSTFGTADVEAADYRACEAYGPLYR